jgi:trehalose synthase
VAPVDPPPGAGNRGGLGGVPAPGKSGVVRDVPVRTLDPARLEPIIGADRAAELLERDAPRARELFGDRRLINVNSTAEGGGVAEMLHVIAGYTLGVGLDSRWSVIDASAEFFALTKRLHNNLYGGPGDGGPLGDTERRYYLDALRPEAEAFAAGLRPGDVVVLHDHQVLGLAAAARRAGARVVWRCHVGTDTANEWTERGWAFLRPMVEASAEAVVVSRRRFAPPWADPTRVAVIQPSIDPFAVKNQDLAAGAAAAIVARAGIVGPAAGVPTFKREDGTAARVTRACEIVREHDPPPADAPLVVQVSRWDPMKDMAGVMEAYAEGVLGSRGAHLVLAGPAVEGVADDPEAAEVFDDCLKVWQSLPAAARRRVHLVCVPMDDVEENAAIVNALQRHAAVVTQKSLAEGFGLTVTEAMYKRRPVVASDVGGIADQIDDGVEGFLVDPHDQGAFAARVAALLADPELAARMGDAGRRRAVRSFLADTHLRRWLELCARLLAG